LTAVKNALPRAKNVAKFVARETRALRCAARGDKCGELFVVTAEQSARVSRIVRQTRIFERGRPSWLFRSLRAASAPHARNILLALRIPHLAVWLWKIRRFLHIFCQPSVRIRTYRAKPPVGSGTIANRVSSVPCRAHMVT